MGRGGHGKAIGLDWTRHCLRNDYIPNQSVVGMPCFICLFGDIVCCRRICDERMVIEQGWVALGGKRKRSEFQEGNFQLVLVVQLIW